MIRPEVSHCLTDKSRGLGIGMGMKRSSQVGLLFMEMEKEQEQTEGEVMVSDGYIFKICESEAQRRSQGCHWGGRGNKDPESGWHDTGKHHTATFC